MSDTELREIFSKNLRYYMDKQGKTQADLYRYMGVTSTTASAWYNGVKAPRLDKIQRLCNWLGIEKSDLLEDHSNETSHYYYDEDARAVAEMLRTNKSYRILFDAARDSKPEDLLMAAEMLRRFKETNPDA